MSDGNSNINRPRSPARNDGNGAKAPPGDGVRREAEPSEGGWEKPGDSTPAITGAGTFPCKGCGGTLLFEPGTESLKCPFCGMLNEIQAGAEGICEEDLVEAMAAMDQAAGTAEAEADDQLVVKCSACGAEAKLAANVTSGKCPFCGTPQVAARFSRKLIRPKALLPFVVTQQKGRGLFKGWLGGRWFAPSDLTKVAGTGDALKGWYIPYWTYDSRIETAYTGQRGDYYYVTENYTTIVNGKRQTQTRRVRRTRWSNASGLVANRFDDVLVAGSGSIPKKDLDEVGQWDTGNLVPYRDEFIAGMQTESYTVDVKTGFDAAKSHMLETVRVTVRRDIGGDEQRISSMNPRYFDLTFKHILVPIWIAAYRYGGTSYRFIINARTGAVAGDRPYSAWKITGFVVMCIVIAGVIAMVVALSNR